MRYLSLAFVLACAVPAHAEVTATSDRGFVSRNTAEVSATPLEVWAQLIAPSRWWNPEHSYTGNADNLYLDAQATGCFCERMPAPAAAPAGQRQGSVEHLHIVYAEPGKALRMVGGLGPLQSEAVTATLTITLRAQDGKTRILSEYVVGGYFRQDVAVLAPMVDRVLGEQLRRLAGRFSGTVAPAPGVSASPPAPTAPPPRPAATRPAPVSPTRPSTPPTPPPTGSTTSP